MKTYDELLKELEDRKCAKCSGTGSCDNAEPGDIYFSTWPCVECDGSGLNDGQA